MSQLEKNMAWQIRVAGLPAPVREYVFHPTRRWRFDFCYPARRLALEVEGGTRRGGRHNLHAGFEADCEKYAEAAILGWRVLRVTSDMVTDGRALTLVERALRAGE